MNARIKQLIRVIYTHKRRNIFLWAYAVIKKIFLFLTNRITERRQESRKNPSIVNLFKKLAIEKSKFQKHFIIDLTPLLPGGENGGAKTTILELIKNMSHLAQDCLFILLTAERMHHQLSILDKKNVYRICALDHRLQPLVGSDLSNQLKADLLFCPFTYSAYVQKDIPTVSIIYDLQYRYYPQFFEAAQIKERDYCFQRACEQSVRLVCPSEYVRSTIIECMPLISSAKIIVIPCACPSRSRIENKNLTFYPSLKKLKLASDRFLLYPANFWRHKNHEMLLLAFSIYCTKNPNSDLKLVLTGQPCKRQTYLISMALKMKLAEKVFFLGYVENEELSTLLHNCRALIFPSLYEGFGMPIWEAMTCGKPVLCSDVTSLPEVGGDAAFLFDPRKPDNIVATIEKIEQNSLLRDNLKQKGPLRAALFPNAEQVAQQYLNTFFEVLNKGG